MEPLKKLGTTFNSIKFVAEPAYDTIKNYFETGEGSLRNAKEEFEKCLYEQRCLECDRQSILRRCGKPGVYRLIERTDFLLDLRKDIEKLKTSTLALIEKIKLVKEEIIKDRNIKKKNEEKMIVVSKLTNMIDNLIMNYGQLYEAKELLMEHQLDRLERLDTQGLYEYQYKVEGFVYALRLFEDNKTKVLKRKNAFELQGGAMDDVNTEEIILDLLRSLNNLKDEARNAGINVLSVKKDVKLWRTSHVLDRRNFNNLLRKLEELKEEWLTHHQEISEYEGELEKYKDTLCQNPKEKELKAVATNKQPSHEKSSMCIIL